MNAAVLQMLQTQTESIQKIATEVSGLKEEIQRLDNKIGDMKAANSEAASTTIVADPLNSPQIMKELRKMLKMRKVAVRWFYQTPTSSVDLEESIKPFMTEYEANPAYWELLSSLSSTIRTKIRSVRTRHRHTLFLGWMKKATIEDSKIEADPRDQAKVICSYAPVATSQAYEDYIYALLLDRRRCHEVANGDPKKVEKYWRKTVQGREEKASEPQPKSQTPSSLTVTASDKMASAGVRSPISTMVNPVRSTGMAGKAVKVVPVAVLAQAVVRPPLTSHSDDKAVAAEKTVPNQAKAPPKGRGQTSKEQGSTGPEGDAMMPNRGTVHATPSSKSSQVTAKVAAKAPPKKRGRPKKDTGSTEKAAPPKRRGRPPKEQVQKKAPPKKRGRPKKQVEQEEEKPARKRRRLTQEDDDEVPLKSKKRTKGKEKAKGAKDDIDDDMGSDDASDEGSD